MPGVALLSFTWRTIESPTVGSPLAFSAVTVMVEVEMPSAGNWDWRASRVMVFSPVVLSAG
jgi:hypothetical protein